MRVRCTEQRILNQPASTTIKSSWYPSDTRWRVSLGIAAWVLVAANSYDLPDFWRGFCERAVPLVLLWLTVLTTIGCGTRVLCWLQKPGTSRRKVEHFCLASALGWAVLSIFLCGMACVGEFESRLIGPIAMISSLFFGLGFDGRRSGWDVCQDVPWFQWTRIYRRDLWTGISGVLTLVIIAITVLWSWGPVWDYDAEMYHLPNAANLLRYGGLVAVVDDPLANLPGQAYLWFALGLSAGSEAYSALLVCWATVITSLLAACIASRWLGIHAALWTLPIYWSGLIVQAVASTPRVEPLYSLMFLAAIALLLEAWQQGKLSWGTAVGCGICLGTAGAIKYQGLYGWLIVGVWWGWLWCRHREWRTSQTACRLVSMFAIGFVILAPWWWKNYQTFHNPIYPMFDRQTIDPDSLRHANPHGPHNRRHGWNFLLIDTWELFTKPNTFSGPPNQWPHYAFLLLPLLIVVWPRSRVGALTNFGLVGGVSAPVAIHSDGSGDPSYVARSISERAGLRTLFWLAAGYYVLSLRLTHELRHLFGMFSLASILCGYVIAQFRIRWGLKVFLPALVTLTMAVVPLHPSRLIRFPAYLQYACGLMSAQELRSQVLTPGFDNAVAWCNAHTPDDAVILLCWESRRYRLHRTAIADSGGSTWTTLFHNRTTAAEVSDYLRAQGVDYVLVNEASLDFNTNRSRLIPKQIGDDFRRQRQMLVPDVLKPVFGASAKSPKAVTVYRVR